MALFIIEPRIGMVFTNLHKWVAKVGNFFARQVGSPQTLEAI